MLSTYSDSLEELLKSRPFQAQSLITPIDDFVYIDEKATTKKVEEIVNDARNKSISSIGIFKNSKPFGYSVIPPPNRKNKNYDPKRDYIKFKSHHYLKYNDTLEIIISKFIDVNNSSEKTTSPPIFLITGENDNNDDLIGLMTYWDLNRRSVYSFIYTIFVYFEQSIKIEIYKSHIDRLDNCIRDFIRRQEVKKKNSRKICDGNCGLNQIISNLKFLELQKLFYDDKHISTTIKEKFPKEVVEAVGSKRNQIAHPVNLIMDNGRGDLFKKNLQILKRICVEGRKIVIDNDDNPKNTMHSSPLNKIEL
ncbi:MAG: hypothetical protein ACYCSO_09370 [Cuniculiplasma sp.]